MPIYEYSVRSTAGGTGASGPFFNIFHYKTDGLSLSELNTVNAAIKTFYDAIKVMYSNTQVWSVGWKVVQIDATPPQLIGVTPLNSVNGTGTGFAPAQLSAVVTWRTATASRSGHGRTFIGPLASTAVGADGQLAGSAGVIQPAAAALLGAVNIADFSKALVVYSRKHKTSIPIISAASGFKAFTQRRRN